MSALFNRHIYLVQAVNRSTTQTEHDIAEATLEGFRQAIDCMVPRPEHLVACDRFYLDQGVDRPMCCGVWLDWKPID